jgi:hypothetical protein
MDISINLTTKNGDFILLNDSQNIEQDENIIIISNKGNIISNLLLGVGIYNYLNGPIPISEISNNIKKELTKDNIIVTSLQISGNDININSKR